MNNVQIIRLTLLTLLLNFNGFSQEKETVHLTGSFWDYATGTDLPNKVTTYWKGSPVSSFSNRSKIEITFSKSTDALLFESTGYTPLKLPVFFWGQFLQESFAPISLKTEKTGTPVEHHNYLIFCKPADFTTTNTYELKHFNGEALHCSQNITAAIHSNNGLMLESKEDFKGQKYQLSVKSNKGIILMTNDFIPQNGINFVDLNLYYNANADPDMAGQTIAMNKLLETKIYYFEQSKYDLSPENKSRLDSLASELIRIPGYNIKIKGFTDHVGNVKLNSTLAEYRSKVVANYLATKGIVKEKIETDWERENKMQDKSVVEPDLKKFRKVEINIKL